jgi:hypothetical protein
MSQRNKSVGKNLQQNSSNYTVAIGEDSTLSSESNRCSQPLYEIRTEYFAHSPRIRLDGCFISVVTYLRRGEVVSIYAPTHLITFYRYFREL